MKTIILTCVALSLISSGAARATEKPNATDASAFGQQANGRIGEIDAYVRTEEKRLPQLTRKETVLEEGALAKASDEKWSKIHTYSDGGKVARLKVYPAGGGKKTEEFYYRNGQLVHVFIEPAGAGKRGYDAGARGEKYYFEKGKLLAAMEGGKMGGTGDSKTRAMAAKLKRESDAFRKVGK